MIIKAILIIGVLSLFLWFIANPKSHQVRAWIKLFMMFFVIMAVAVILFPRSANNIAHFVGVGRGADLLLYVLAIAFVYEVVSQYMKNKEDQRRFIILARKLAILEANNKKK